MVLVAVKAGGESHRGGLRVGCLGERTDDDDPVGAGGQNLVEMGVVDAADGEPGAGGAEFGQFADRLQAGGRAAWFGGCGPDRADAEVVDIRVPSRIRCVADPHHASGV